jgi:regulator of CtrA degradation
VGWSMAVSGVIDARESALFERTFQDGMSLVEDTAAYLDGAGRQEARLLVRSNALAYANASMRLTTQLMQVASWLLVQRAVREGDMAASEACEARYRLGGASGEPLIADVGDETEETPVLPVGLLSLLERTRKLHERVAHLDRRMYCEALEAAAANPVMDQMDRLRAAFAG